MDVAQRLESGGVPMPTAVRFRTPLGEGFSEKFDVFSIVSMSLGKTLYSHMLHWLRCKLVPGIGQRWQCVWLMVDTPKWLQGCMFLVALKWRMNEQIQWPRGNMWSLPTWYQTINLQTNIDWMPNVLKAVGVPPPPPPLEGTNTVIQPGVHSISNI